MSRPPATVEIDRSTVHPVRRAALWLSRAISYVAYAYLMIVEIILFLGFLLLLLGANPSSSFVEWVYRSMDRAMRPFRGIFEPIEIGVTQADVPSIFETSVVFAMIVYAILALVIHALTEWLNGRLHRLDREDEEYRRQQLVNQALAADSRTPSAPVAATGVVPPVTSTPPTPPTPPPPSGTGG
jgi:hypothetical protein